MHPDLFIVDRHPFGVRGGLRPAPDTPRNPSCRTVPGLHEVLDAPEAPAAATVTPRQLPADLPRVAQHV